MLRNRRQHTFDSITVNIVIFDGGKFRENINKTFHVGVIFTILILYPHKGI